MVDLHADVAGGMGTLEGVEDDARELVQFIARELPGVQRQVNAALGQLAEGVFVEDFL